MRYKAAGLGIGTPSDGYTDEEKLLQRVITEESLKTLYGKLPTNRMKFIVAAHFELGYSQEMIAEMLGIKQPSLQDEIQHIKRVLKGNPYKPYKRKKVIKLEDLMKYCLLMKHE